MARGIKLRRYAIRHANHYHIRGFRIRVEVVEVNGDAPRHVFVYRRPPVNVATGDQLDEFFAIASFPDIAEYPVSSPDPERPFPFFRLDYVELDVRSLTDYDRVWNWIVNEVDNLMNAMDKADDLEPQEDVWVGQAPDASEASTTSEGA